MKMAAPNCGQPPIELMRPARLERATFLIRSHPGGILDEFYRGRPRRFTCDVVGSF
jgi:hypothetical protein